MNHEKSVKQSQHLSTHQKRVGALIRARREELGLSLYDVSRALGGRRSASFLGYWERGERAIKVEDLAELAGVLGAATLDLLPPEPAPWYDQAAS